MADHMTKTQTNVQDLNYTDSKISPNSNFDPTHVFVGQSAGHKSCVCLFFVWVSCYSSTNVGDYSTS